MSDDQIKSVNQLNHAHSMHSAGSQSKLLAYLVENFSKNRVNCTLPLSHVVTTAIEKRKIIISHSFTII